MPLPALLFLGPLILAVPFYLLARRWPRATGLAGGIGVLILRSTLSGASESAASLNWIVLGRTLFLSTGLRETLLFIYAVVALLLFLSAIWPQGVDFVPGSLIAISLLTAALMVQQFVYGVILLLIAAGVMTVMLQSGRAGSTRASLRYLLMTAIAVPLFLLAGWLLDSGSLAFIGVSWRLLLIGLLILLAGFPFFIWVRPIVSEAGPLVTLFVLGLGQLALVLLAAGMLAAFPPILRDTQFYALMQLAGAATVAVSALLAFGSMDWGRLIGYVLLADMGAVILALSYGAEGFPAVLTLVVMRVVSLLLAGMGLAVMRGKAGVLPASKQWDNFAATRETAWRQPLAAGLLIFGILSLAGFPLTPGFAGRWLALSLTATTSPAYAALLVMATASGVIGALRAAYLLAKRPETLEMPPENSAWNRFRQAPRAEQSTQIVLAVALAAGILLALFPQLLLALVPRFAFPIY